MINDYFDSQGNQSGRQTHETFESPKKEGELNVA